MKKLMNFLMDSIIYGTHFIMDFANSYPEMHVSMRKAPKLGNPFGTWSSNKCEEDWSKRNANEQMPKECGDYINNLELKNPLYYMYGILYSQTFGQGAVKCQHTFIYNTIRAACGVYPTIFSFAPASFPQYLNYHSLLDYDPFQAIPKKMQRRSNLNST